MSMLVEVAHCTGIRTISGIVGATVVGSKMAAERLLATAALLLTTAVVTPVPYPVCVVRPPIVDIIARREGFFVRGSAPARLHNPGSLVFAGQPGAVKTRLRGLARFPTNAAGWLALERDVAAKHKRGACLCLGWVYLRGY